MQAITPYSVLCPSTPFFLLSLVAYVFGLYKYSALDTQEFERGFVYAYSIISGLIHLDRHNILVSFQITMPLAIWTATIMIPVGIWMFRTIFPGTHRKYLEGKRKRDEEWKKLLESKRERVGDVESGEGAVERVDPEAGPNYGTVD